MKARARFVSLALVVAVVSATQSGCFWLASHGPNLGPLAIPIPVPVGIQKQKEDQFWNYERYERSPVLGPLQPGGPCSNTWSRDSLRSRAAAMKTLKFSRTAR